MEYEIEYEYDFEEFTYLGPAEYEYEYEYEGPEVISASEELISSTAPCPVDFTRDCSYKCQPAYVIGNGMCNDGGIAKDQERVVAVSHMLTTALRA